MTSPFVAIRTDVRKDERFSVLADVCGYSRHEAVGRMVDLWAWCTDRRLLDAPADCRGYAISESVACRFLGQRGMIGLLGDGCDEFALAELRSDGLLYLRGTEDSVSRQRGHRITAVAGGEARVAKASRSAGKFVSQTAINQPSTSCEPAGDQQGHQPEPATNHKPQTTEDPESEIPVKAKRARRLDPDWAPERAPANELAEQAAKARGVDLREELAKLRDWANGNGAKRTDWNAVWRNWTRNARPIQQGRSRGATALELQFERISMLEREERDALEKAGAP